jgi:hypothetical protein
MLSLTLYFSLLIDYASEKLVLLAMAITLATNILIMAWGVSLAVSNSWIESQLHNTIYLCRSCSTIYHWWTA